MSQTQPPYPDHDCPACTRGEKTVTPPHSSTVGSMPVHQPSGNVCQKYIQPAMLDALKKAKMIREQTAKPISLHCAACGKYLGDNNDPIQDGPHKGARPTDMTQHCDSTGRQEGVVLRYPNPAHALDCSDPHCLGCWNESHALIASFPDGLRFEMRAGRVVGIDHNKDIARQPLATATGVMAMIEDQRAKASAFIEAGWAYSHAIAGAEICEDHSCFRCRLARLLFETEAREQGRPADPVPQFDITRELVTQHTYQPTIERDPKTDLGYNRVPTEWRDAGSHDGEEEHF